MNSKMGYILIVLGLAIVVWGIIIVRKPQKKTETIEINNEQTVKNEAKPTVNEKIQQDDFDENKAKGDAFEFRPEILHIARMAQRQICGWNLCRFKSLSRFGSHF